MNRSSRIWPALLIISLLLFAPSALSAATLFESGTLGPTGIPRSEVVGGSNVSRFVFVGARFHLDQPALTTQIGGHFVKNTAANDSFFGAIVALDDEHDFPNSADLSTPDVVGTTLLAFPEPSGEVLGAFHKSLAPGWYAVVFGSGLMGANGSGVAINNGMDIDSPSYIGFQTGSVNGWSDLMNPIFRNFRFVVAGTVIPEPSVIVLLSAGLLPVLFIRNVLRNCWGS